MDYISTRGSAPTLDFRAATLAGLASDGGLYVPAKWPRLSLDEIRALAGLDYVDTAVRVMAPFLAGALSGGELRDRKSRVSGNRVSGRVDIGGRRFIKKNNNNTQS